MSADRAPEQPRGLEPAQPVSPDITGRGRERWSLGKPVKLGLGVFAVSFGLLEAGFVSAGFITELPKITSASLEVAAIFGLIAGLSAAKVKIN